MFPVLPWRDGWFPLSMITSRFTFQPISFFALVIDALTGHLQVKRSRGPFLFLLDPKYRLLGLAYPNVWLALWNDMEFVALLGLNRSSPQATDAVPPISLFMPLYILIEFDIAIGLLSLQTAKVLFSFTPFQGFVFLSCSCMLSFLLVLQQ
ncbi:hypothetical protein KFK09_023219 [Dendrobium nobile]|uniref:Uncharacterized protein n=1 Tax=Dendrobium nobile TaxID=94219 RepID=A0A8T3AKW7_DENNO|nr:hypothetical protein KFK09_023219 [Dendrobium nobile]